MDEKEVELIYQYESYKIENAYNMVCGDKLGFDKSTNISEEYKLEIILKKLKANGHDPKKYVVITDELGQKIVSDYLDNKLSIKPLVRKYGITKQRINRFIQSQEIKIDKNRCKLTNSKVFTEEEIQKIIDLYHSGILIKEIAKQERLTIMIVSRVLHDSGTRISKRFLNGRRW